MPFPLYRHVPHLWISFQVINLICKSSVILAITRAHQNHSNEMSFPTMLSTRTYPPAGSLPQSHTAQCLPMMKVETLTTEPENLEGSEFGGHNIALREHFSSSSGRNPACDSLVLTDSLLSVSSVVLAIWYAKLGCSG